MTWCKPCSSRVTQGWLSRIVSRQLPDSSKDEGSITSLAGCAGARGHTHNEKVFPEVQSELPVFSMCLWPLVLALGTTGKSLAPSALHRPSSPSFTFVSLHWPLPIMSPLSPWH